MCFKDIFGFILNMYMQYNMIPYAKQFYMLFCMFTVQIADHCWYRTMSSTVRLVAYACTLKTWRACKKYRNHMASLMVPENIDTIFIHVECFKIVSVGRYLLPCRNFVRSLWSTDLSTCLNYIIVFVYLLLTRQFALGHRNLANISGHR